MEIDIRNIRNIDYLTMIPNIIEQTKDDYKGLTTEQTCIIYSNILSEKLSNNHIPHKIIDTEDLGSTYKHEFVLIPYNESYILCDLTYTQFYDVRPEFMDLLNKGYQVINDGLLNDYLVMVTKDIDEFNFSASDIYYGSIEQKSR